MNYAVDDEFGNQITTGLDTFDAAKQAARRYLSAHKDAPAVTIYTETSFDTEGESESWELSRAEVVS